MVPARRAARDQPVEDAPPAGPPREHGPVDGLVGRLERVLQLQHVLLVVPEKEGNLPSPQALAFKASAR